METIDQRPAAAPNPMLERAAILLAAYGQIVSQALAIVYLLKWAFALVLYLFFNTQGKALSDALQLVNTMGWVVEYSIFIGIALRVVTMSFHYIVMGRFPGSNGKFRLVGW